MADVIVNADDLAFDEDVDDGIFKLAGCGTVTAASAMVLSSRWPETAVRFNRVAIDLGLHLDFTSPFAPRTGVPHGLAKLIASAVSGSIDRRAVEAAILLQLQRFEDAAGKPPDFVDGHQHVHHLPVVRDALAAVLWERYAAAQTVAIRNCMPRRWRGVKAAVVGWTGAAGLERLAEAKGLPMNSDFAGVYNFSAHAPLAGLWQSWLSRLKGPLPLIMCHPAAGCRSAPGHDPIKVARRREFAWLSSEEFHQLCRSLALKPGRWRSRAVAPPIAPFLR